VSWAITSTVQNLWAQLIYSSCTVQYSSAAALSSRQLITPKGYTFSTSVVFFAPSTAIHAAVIVQPTPSLGSLGLALLHTLTFQSLIFIYDLWECVPLTPEPSLYNEVVLPSLSSTFKWCNLLLGQEDKKLLSHYFCVFLRSLHFTENQNPPQISAQYGAAKWDAIAISFHHKT